MGTGEGRGDLLVELSGLAAKSSQVQVDRERFREERIRIIGERLRSSKPLFVVMYGLNERLHWESIAGMPLVRDGVVQTGTTIVAFAPHPQDRGRRNSDWKDLGEKLRLEFKRI
jgi:hypothetical protein